MFKGLVTADPTILFKALAIAGRNERLRNAIFDALRRAQSEADDPLAFSYEIRWPLVLSLLTEVRVHRIVLKNGLVFEISPDSRIEQAFLLSPETHPDHVWEPQTTKLLIELAADVSQVIVGGAYIGDQVIPLAHAIATKNPPGTVHAFEPMELAYRRLLRNLELNSIDNVVVHRLGLWDKSNTSLGLKGAAAIAFSVPFEEGESDELTESITIDDYAESRQLSSVGLIMLDTEGGEERALHGARGLISRPWPEAPHIIFEIHRNFVDWTMGLEHTSIVKFLTLNDYTVFAIRDFHDNYPMTGRPIEIIPVDCVYLEGPPHGFNLLATKDPGLVKRLELRIVENVSPKLLLHKDPGLHHPLDGFR